ncbi:MAG: putative acetyltransferase, family [Sphingomonas bacterium]|uniref:GNAT family N-acetyltransferase n=1 Tax=Sphingomonas bacterium TaxID=1895847 RepID=UPI00261B44A5|nr:GNAT family N-acetyltransferase [Sphingomonas bacterium]MDB5710314.1 putative acetyltransferase, family [Sphingomonas bacterium]
MVAFTVRPTVRADAAALADLLNEIIAAGGTTAYQIPFTPEGFATAHIDGPAVLTSVVAQDEAGAPLGFQILLRHERLPERWGDIGTFARRGMTTRGIGSALFAATREAAKRLGLVGINATIRADNSGGLAFYGKQGFVDHSVASAVPLNDGTPVDRISKRYPLV